MRRQRQSYGTATRFCAVCGAERSCVLYQSWERPGRLSRRRVDVRWRWQCLHCDTRIPATGQEISHAV